MALVNVPLTLDRLFLPVFPKALPKNEIMSFWGKWVPCFWEYVMTPQIPLS